QGVTVGGVDLSGMTRTEATAALDAGYATYMNTPITLSFNGDNYAVTPNQLGLRVDSGASIDQAMAYGRDGSLWTRSQDWARALLRGSNVPAVIVPTTGTTDAALLTLTPNVARAPANASLDLSGDEPAVVPDIPGVGFDYGTTRAMIIDRVAQQSYVPVPLATTTLNADVSAATLSQTLPSVQTAASTALSISGVDGTTWSLDQAQLKSLISVSADGTSVTVNQDAITQLVSSIAKSLEHESSDATLFVDAGGKLAVKPGVQALSVNQKKSVDQIASAITAGAGTVELVTSFKDPAITTEMATASRKEIQTTLGNGITIKWEGGSGKITTKDLLSALIIKPTPGKDDPFAFSLSHKILKGYIDTITNGFQVEPLEAKFRLVDGKVTAVEKGRTGIVINVDDSVTRIEKAILAGYSSSNLKVDTIKPRYSASDAATISLPDVLGEASTPYSSSTEARKINVERAVDLETGWLVAPGDEFSYDKTMGQVTEDNGFVVGLGILADPNNPGQVTTGPVVGGGICQVSTTVFQSAFWAGMNFLERYQHPYWIKSYGIGTGGMQGLDAMVNIEPEGSTEAMTLDMRFVNTTDNWIAVELTADGQNVTSRILGTDQGWNVAVGDDDPQVSNIVQPDETEVRQDTPELAAGDTRQVETAAEGFDTSITRTVTDKDGNVIDVYQLNSSYGTTVNRVLVGTGQ
ncbi:MAG TPA: peptidoglycan binding domain-containing protein, partial [Thermomicrobiales bacterium]|nr:peptidoglycan binding domain-containing protein [Thermomicrobiales bacterium]